MKKLAIIAGISFAMCVWAPALESMNKVALHKQQREREMYWRSWGNFGSKALFHCAVSALLNRDNGPDMPWDSQSKIYRDLRPVVKMGGPLFSCLMQSCVGNKLTNSYDMIATLGGWVLGACVNSANFIPEGAGAAAVVLGCLSQWPSHDYAIESAKERAKHDQLIDTTNFHWGRACYKSLLSFGFAVIAQMPEGDFSRRGKMLAPYGEDGIVAPLTGHWLEGNALVLGGVATAAWGIFCPWVCSTWSPYVYIAGASCVARALYNPYICIPGARSLEMALSLGMKFGSAATLMGLCIAGLVEGVSMLDESGGFLEEFWESKLIAACLAQDEDVLTRYSDSCAIVPWYSVARSIKKSKKAGRSCHINTIKFKGESLLHLAARQDHYRIIAMLIENGHDTEVRNSQGLKPVEVALQEGSYRALKTFLLFHKGCGDLFDSQTLSLVRAANINDVWMF